MLESLTLWNIGGIRRAELPFGPGLTVITGESGAGKSSVVRALELAAGKRGEARILRAGETDGGAEARFFIENKNFSFPGLDEPLQPDNGMLLARRAIRGSHSRASLQGVQVPLTTYSLAADRLIHIQSQFAQMELLNGDSQLAMVDSCTGTGTAPGTGTALELRQTFERARECAAELKAVSRRRSDVEQKYANANEVLSLVRRVAPEPGLEAALEERLSSLARRIARRERADDSLDRLLGGLSEQGLLNNVRNSFESLLDAVDENGNEDGNEHGQPGTRRTVNEALRLLENAAATAREALGQQENDAQERDALEARLGALRRLRRLSGTEDEAGLLAYCRDASENLEWLEKSYSQLDDMSKKSLALKKQASALAMRLRRERRDAASALEKRVNGILGDLAMAGTVFEIHFKELHTLRRSGADEIEFALRSGPRVGRVDKIASGGELSRLLLALQLSLPDEWLPPTLVFDEVEAGLGGRAAVLSGMKLKELSRRCQVLLVTHEASIAALGDAHILIQRSGGESQVRLIDGEERVREIARMLSGSPDLEEAREHARTLLQGPGAL